MSRRFQFSLCQVILAFLFAGTACWLFPIAFEDLNTSDNAAGPILLVLASSSTGAVLDALFGKAAYMAAVGAALAVVFMASILVFFGTF